MSEWQSQGVRHFIFRSRVTNCESEGPLFYYVGLCFQPTTYLESHRQKSVGRYKKYIYEARKILHLPYMIPPTGVTLVELTGMLESMKYQVLQSVLYKNVYA